MEFTSQSSFVHQTDCCLLQWWCGLQNVCRLGQGLLSWLLHKREKVLLYQLRTALVKTLPMLPPECSGLLRVEIHLPEHSGRNVGKVLSHF